MSTPNNTDTEIDPRLEEIAAAIYCEEEHAGLELGTSAAWELHCAYSKLIAVTIGDAGRGFQSNAPVELPNAETPGDTYTVGIQTITHELFMSAVTDYFADYFPDTED